MNSSPCPFWVSFSHWIQLQIKGWLKPTTVTLALGALADLSRSKADLLVENALLRQQLIVLHRQVKRPKLTMATGSGLSCWPNAQNSGIKHSILSNRIRSCAGIEIYSACIGGIFPIEERKSREYPLKRYRSSVD
jgi:hypothetical protein